MAIDWSGLPDQGRAQAKGIDWSNLPDGPPPDQGQPQNTPVNAPSTPDSGPDSAGAAYMSQFQGPRPVQPLSAEEQSRTGQLTNEPAYVTGGTEPTKVSEALRANIQPMLEHPIDAFTGMFTNWDDVAHLYQHPEDILGPNAKRALGMPVSPEEEMGSQQWYNTLVGAALAAGAFHGGEGVVPRVEPEVPEIPEASVEVPTEAPPVEPVTFAQPGERGFTGTVPPWEQYASASDLRPGAPQPTVPTPDELSSVEAQAGQGDTEPVQSPGVGSPDIEGVVPETREAPVATKNEYTQGRRQVLGMEPAEEVVPRSDESVQAEADATLRRTPDAGARLAQKLTETPRPISDTENVLLRSHINDLERQHSELIDHINKTQDPAAVEQLNGVRDNLIQAYDAANKTGTELGRGLRQRQVGGTDQYTLPKMEAETRAVNGGAPLEPAKLKQVSDLHAKIADLEAKLAAREKAITEGRVSSPARRSFLNRFDDQAEAARARIIARRGRLNVGFDPTALSDEIIIGANHIAHGVKNFDAWSSKMLDEFGDRVKPYMRELYERARATFKDASSSSRPSFKPTGATAEAVKDFQRQDRYRTATINKTKALQEKTASGDVSAPPQRADLILDPVSQKLRDQYQKAKYDYQVMLEKDRLAQRPMLRKLADVGVNLERAMKLTGLKVFGKLGSAGPVRVAQTATEGALAKAMSYAPVLRRVMEAAPTEGPPTLRSAAAYGKGFAQGVRDIPGVVSGRILTRDVKEGTLPKVQSVFDVPGRLHGAIKQPFKKAAETASIQKAIDTAARQGIDINKPGVIEGAQARGKEAGLRAIWTNDNMLSNSWNNLIQSWEHSKTHTSIGYASAKVGQFLLPIVRVPTNIALEAGTMNTGLFSGSAKLMQVMKRGMETIKPEEADMIARHYKKGLVGAGLFLTGYFNRDKFGGFYQDYQTKKSDKVERNGMQPGQAKFGAMTIPDWILLHSPAGLVMQEGAMVGKLMDTGKSGVGSYIGSASKIIQEVPFVREMSAIDDLLKGNWEAKRAGGNLLKSTVVPQGVQDVASYIDKWNSGLPRKRSPQTAMEYIMSGVPGLREGVPLSKHQYP